MCKLCSDPSTSKYQWCESCSYMMQRLYDIYHPYKTRFAQEREETIRIQEAEAEKRNQEQVEKLNKEAEEMIERERQKEREKAQERRQAAAAKLEQERLQLKTEIALLSLEKSLSSSPTIGERIKCKLRLYSGKLHYALLAFKDYDELPL